MALVTAFILSLQAPVTAPAGVERFAEGQVWEYRTRPADAGSLVRIQRIEPMPGDPQRRPIYHVAIIGVHLSRPGMDPVLPHLPVSRATLEASVTRLSSVTAGFPTPADTDAGIAEWRANEGGVFTITLADIVGVVDQMVQRAAGERAPGGR